MSREQFQPVVFQPTTYRGMQTGIRLMVDAVRPTLGPLPRVVAIERSSRDRPPEMLDHGATILRRIIEIPDRDADVGAMFVRHMLWQVNQAVGDGTVTAAVLFESVFDQGVRYIVAGGNAMRMRRFLEEGLRVIRNCLERMAKPLAGKQALAQMAKTVCYDADLALLLGEIFDIIGEYGQLDIRSSRGRKLERQYVEGMYWDSGLWSRQMVTDRKKLRTELQNAAILITDLELEEATQLAPVVQMAHEANIPGLVIVAKQPADAVIGSLASMDQQTDACRVVAVKTPGMALSDQMAAMEDLTVLTGGRRVVQTAGDTLAGVRLEDLGRARRIWADLDHFGIVGGRGDPRQLRTHIHNLRAAFAQATEADTRKRLQGRIGKLMGGSAVLFVGGATESEIEARKELGQRTADALRGAVREGVVPGGGVAFLACRSALQERLKVHSDVDSKASYRILIRAMEAPIRAIVQNAGYDPGAALAKIERAGEGYGFDVRSGSVEDMNEAGIWDVAAVLTTAVSSAIASAALALTTDVLVHHKKRRPTMEP